MGQLPADQGADDQGRQEPSQELPQVALEVADPVGEAGEGYWKCDWCGAIKHESEEDFRGYTDEEATEELDATFCSMKCALGGAQSGQFHYTEEGASAKRDATIGGIVGAVLLVIAIILWNVYCGD